MQWNRVVDARADASFGKSCLQRFAIRYSHHVEVIHSLRPSRFRGDNDKILRLREKFVIAVSEGSARFIPPGKVLELHGQPAGLDGIEPAIIALHVVIILLRLAVITNHLHALGHRLVISCDGSAFTASTEILSGVKAECSSFADGSCLFPGIGLF